MKIILDTNVVLDTILKRGGFFYAAYEVVKLSVQNKVEAVLPTSIITDVYYVLNRSDKAKAKPVLEGFVGLLSMCEVVPADIHTAFASDMDDFEDAVIASVANRVKADYIVTRNKKDFIKSPVSAVTPEEFIELYSVKN